MTQQHTEKVFSDVDASGIAAELIAYLDVVGARPDVRAVDELSHELLAPRPGWRVLDVGCGLGDDTRDIARLVAPGGHVTGVDLSRAMIAEAIRRTPDAVRDAVTFEPADVTDLPYADAAFDAVRTERVLQHVRDASRAVAEMARVTKPGGRVVAIDTDWPSFMVEAPAELRDAVLRHAVGMMARPAAGRQLPSLLAAAGLTGITVKAVTLFDTSLAGAREVFPQLDSRIPPDEGLLPLELRDEWFAALEAVDAAGGFFAGVTMVIAGGVKPA